MEDWRSRLVTDGAGIARVLRDSHRVAVLGMKTEAQAGQPAFYVPEFLHEEGYDIVPVPVYYPEVKEILGKPVYRKVADVPGELDLVLVFRRSHDVPPHVPDILAKRPKAVWMQSGIRNDAAAEELARAGIEVVQDRCAMVEYGRVSRGR